MSPITHFLMGWAVANSAPSLDKRERAMVTWAGVVPDVDGLGIVADLLTRNSSHTLNWWGDYHHILAHNLGFTLAVAVIPAILAKQRVKFDTTIRAESWRHANKGGHHGRLPANSDARAAPNRA